MSEQDRKIVEDAKRFPRSDFVESLISVIDRLDKQSTDMQALLKRWVKWHDGFLSVEPLNDILDDTKQLLKEVKEVRHGQ